MATKTLNIDDIIKASDKAMAEREAKKKELYGPDTTLEKRFLSAYKEHLKSEKK